MQKTLVSFKPICNDFSQKLSFGVEVEGIDLSQPLSSKDWETILKGFDEHSLLVFRNQKLTPQMELDFLTRFPHDKEAVSEGKNVAPFYRKLPGVHPLFSLHGYGEFDYYGHKINLPAAQQFKYARVWHTDFNSISDTPPVVSSMYAEIVPQIGGETLFVSAIEAFEILPKDFQEQIISMKVNYCPARNFKVSDSGTRRIDDLESSLKLFDPPNFGRVHPLVIKTQKGKNALFISTHSALNIEGMQPEPSQQLIESLLKPVTQPKYIFNFKWKVGDFVVWNNREIIHSGTPWHVYEQERRLMHIIFLDSTEKVIPA